MRFFESHAESRLRLRRRREEAHEDAAICRRYFGFAPHHLCDVISMDFEDARPSKREMKAQRQEDLSRIGAELLFTFLKVRQMRLAQGAASGGEYEKFTNIRRQSSKKLEMMKIAAVRFFPELADVG